MSNKQDDLKQAIQELDRAINDIEKKYGNEIDTIFLKNKFEEILKKLQKK